MSDIAFAFSVVDAEMSEKIAFAVEDAGLKVLRAPLTPSALENASVVVAVWSATSVHSAIVNDVARQAADADKLISVKVGLADIPAQFAGEEVFDLHGWTGAGRTPAVDDFLAALTRLAKGRAWTRKMQQAQPKVAHAQTLSMSTAARFSGASMAQGGIMVRSPPAIASTAVEAKPPAGGTPITAPPEPKPEPILYEPEHEYLAREAAFWLGIRDSSLAADYLRYLESFGEDGVFAELARYRLRVLFKGQEDDTPKKKRPERRKARSGGISRLGFGAIGVTVLAAAAVMQFARGPIDGDYAGGLIGNADAHVRAPLASQLTATEPPLHVTFNAERLAEKAPAPAPKAALKPLIEPQPVKTVAAEPAKKIEVAAAPKPAPQATVKPIRRAYTASLSPAPLDLSAVDLAAADGVDLAKPTDSSLDALSKLESRLKERRVVALAALEDLPPLEPIPLLPIEESMMLAPIGDGR